MAIQNLRARISDIVSSRTSSYRPDQFHKDVCERCKGMVLGTRAPLQSGVYFLDGAGMQVRQAVMADIQRFKQQWGAGSIFRNPGRRYDDLLDERSERSANAYLSRLVVLEANSHLLSYVELGGTDRHKVEVIENNPAFNGIKGRASILFRYSALSNAVLSFNGEYRQRLEFDCNSFRSPDGKRFLRRMFLGNIMRAEDANPAARAEIRISSSDVLATMIYLAIQAKCEGSDPIAVADLSHETGFSEDAIAYVLAQKLEQIDGTI